MCLGALVATADRLSVSPSGAALLPPDPETCLPQPSRLQSAMPCSPASQPSMLLPPYYNRPCPDPKPSRPLALCYALPCHAVLCRAGEWKIIDFGLARRYTDDAGDVLPERTDTAFRGSTTYASVFAHQEQDLGRRDDLWSWLYCVVELLDGTYVYVGMLCCL